MAGLRFKGLVGVIIGSSLMVSSTGAVAASSRAPVAQINPWAALAVMSGTAPASVLCGSAAAAAAATQTPGTGCVLPATETPPPVAQTEPPPPIPVPPVEAAGGAAFNPLLLALGAILAATGLYFIVRKHTNSPA